jgi:hypothetical protein
LVGGTHGIALATSRPTLLVDSRDNSTAVVVRVTNPSSSRAVADAPITVDLVDRRGSVVGAAPVAGTDPLLVHVPYIGPGESVLFVDDTIAPTATPAQARVRVTAVFTAVRPVRLSVRALHLRTERLGFSSAIGTLVGSRVSRTRDVLIQAVVRRRGQIVAAGTTVVRAPVRGRPRSFDIILTGHPKGGELRVWAPPQ